MKYLAQSVAYAAFAAVLAGLSVWPEYRLLPPEKAVVSLTVSHAGQRIGECRQLTQDELNELPPNMRKPSECPRERHPITIELRADGELLYRVSSPPSGIWSDGKATVYQRLQMAAGEHELFVAMNDSGGEGFDFELSVNQRLSPGQNLVIDFDELQQAFVFR